jgi:hypothetical protein
MSFSLPAQVVLDAQHKVWLNAKVHAKTLHERYWQLGGPAQSNYDHVTKAMQEFALQAIEGIQRHYQAHIAEIEAAHQKQVAALQVRISRLEHAVDEKILPNEVALAIERERESILRAVQEFRVDHISRYTDEANEDKAWNQALDQVVKEIEGRSENPFDDMRRHV